MHLETYKRTIDKCLAVAKIGSQTLLAGSGVGAVGDLDRGGAGAGAEGRSSGRPNGFDPMRLVNCRAEQMVTRG